MPLAVWLCRKESGDTDGHSSWTWASNVSLTSGKLTLGCSSQNAACRLRSDPSPLLSSAEAPPGVLHPDCGFQVKERLVAATQSPTKGHYDNLGRGVSLPWGEAGRPGTVQHVQKSKGSVWRRQIWTSSFSGVQWQKKPNQHELKHSMFHLNIRRHTVLGEW